jgi:hypothetical protein
MLWLTKVDTSDSYIVYSRVLFLVMLMLLPLTLSSILSLSLFITVKAFLLSSYCLFTASYGPIALPTFTMRLPAVSIVNYVLNCYIRVFISVLSTFPLIYYSI